MHFIAIVILANIMINPVAGRGASTIEEYNREFDAQFKQPKIEAVYTNFND